jgi:hypothetical protein
VAIRGDTALARSSLEEGLTETRAGVAKLHQEATDKPAAKSFKERAMFLILAVILAALWIGGFTVLHVTSFAIHILIVMAVVSVVLHLVRGSRAT